MVTRAHRTLHGPNLCPQGADRDERPDGFVRLRTSNQIRLEAPDAQDGKAGRHFVFCARRSVSQPHPLIARTPTEPLITEQLCGYRNCPLLADLHGRSLQQSYRNFPHDIHAVQHRTHACRSLYQHPDATTLLPSLENQAKDIFQRPDRRPG